MHGYFTSEPVMKRVLKVEIMPGKEGLVPTEHLTPKQVRRPDDVVGIGFDATCSLVAMDDVGAPVTVSPDGAMDAMLVAFHAGAHLFEPHRDPLGNLENGTRPGLDRVDQRSQVMAAGVITDHRHQSGGRQQARARIWRQSFACCARLAYRHEKTVRTLTTLDWIHIGSVEGKAEYGMGKSFTKESLGVGIAGTGFIGPVHVEALRRNGVRVIGVAEVENEVARRKADELGIPRSYGSVDEMLADPEVHVVHLATPNYLHYPQAKAALMAGKHVVCEKPLAMNTNESGELVRLAAERCLVNVVNFNNRMYPLAQQARSMVQAGDIACGQFASDFGLRADEGVARVSAASLSSRADAILFSRSCRSVKPSQVIQSPP